MTRLFVTGDSWTSCWPLEETTGSRNLGWPTLVSNHFDWQLTDKSRAASSNFRIFRKTFDAILTNNFSIVIVALTKWERMETGYPNQGKIYQHVPSDPQSVLLYSDYFHGYLNYSQCLRMIIALQYAAKIHNTPLYFLDTFESNILRTMSLESFKNILKFNPDVFNAMDDERILDKLNTITFLTNQIDFDAFISEQSYQSIIAGCALEKKHPVEDGHAKIAETIIEFLESKYYGKTI